jgi:predicted ArsR family transcriptional regulator
MPRSVQGTFDWPVPARARDTSQAAAASITAEAPQLRLQVLHAIQQAGRARGMTADEAAQRLRRSVLSVRPRVAELAREGLIEDSGARRSNASGRGAIVWIVATAKGPGA